MSAVAYGLQDSHEYIVHNEGEGTHKIDAEINGRFRQYVRRRSHPYEDMGSEEDAGYRQKDSGGESESNGRMYRFFY